MLLSVSRQLAFPVLPMPYEGEACFIATGLTARALTGHSSNAFKSRFIDRANERPK